MLSIPRWYLAFLYFITSASLLKFGNDAAAANDWSATISYMFAAFFFIGLAYHSGRLLQKGWRRFQTWRRA